MKWTRRSLAFLIDYVLIEISWGIVNNLVTVPISEVIMMLGSPVWFCLYFAMTEGVGEVRASPGKRVAKIAVRCRDGRLASLRAVVARAAILAALLNAEWDDILLGLSSSTPLFIVTLAWSIPMGLALYNVWLAVRKGERLMLQDALTNTEVTWTSPIPVSDIATGSARQPQIEWPKPAICAAIVGLVSISNLLIPTAPQFLENFAAQRELERAVMHEIGVRARVREPTFAVPRDMSESGEGRSFLVAVWLPWLAWDEATAQKTGAVIIKILTARIGYYDRGFVVLWTGGPILTVVRGFGFTMPTAPGNLGRALTKIGVDLHRATRVAK